MKGHARSDQLELDNLFSTDVILPGEEAIGAEVMNPVFERIQKDLMEKNMRERANSLPKPRTALAILMGRNRPPEQPPLSSVFEMQIPAALTATPSSLQSSIIRTRQEEEHNARIQAVRQHSRAHASTSRWSDATATESASLGASLSLELTSVGAPQQSELQSIPLTDAPPAMPPDLVSRPSALVTLPEANSLREASQPGGPSQPQPRAFPTYRSPGWDPNRWDLSGQSPRNSGASEASVEGCAVEPGGPSVHSLLSKRSSLAGSSMTTLGSSARHPSRDSCARHSRGQESTEAGSSMSLASCGGGGLRPSMASSRDSLARLSKGPEI